MWGNMKWVGEISCGCDGEGLGWDVPVDELLRVVLDGKLGVSGFMDEDVVGMGVSEARRR